MLTLLLLQGAAGCASAALVPSPAAMPAPSPVPPGEALLDAHATILRLEDRREFDAPTLAGLAADSSARVRARTALALGRLRVPAGAPLLLRLLVDGDSVVAATAAFSLGQFRDSTYAEPLASRLRAAGDSAPTVASEAAYALGKGGGLRARDALIELLQTHSIEDRRSAPAAGAALLAIWKLPRLPSLSPVVRWLQAPDAELRWRAAYALARRFDPRALPHLRRAMSDPEPAVRAQAVRGLTAIAADSAGIPRSDVAGEVVMAVADSSYEVAVNALRVLGGYPEASVVEVLADMSHHADRHLAISAIESLGRLGVAARAASPNLAAVAGADSLPLALRATALESLARIDPSVATGLTVRFGGSPAWRLRAAAARAAAVLEGSTGTGVRERLTDDDPRVAAAALQAAIDEAGDDLLPLRPLLIEQLGARDAMVRAAALGALANSPDPALLPALLDAYARAQGDTLNDAALAALDAIGAISGEGSSPARAFLARFRRPNDALVRQRAVERLDSAAIVAAWGDPLPIETNRSPADYRQLVDWLVAPALAGARAPEIALATAGDTIRLRLFADEAPLTVESFLRLAEAGYFDGQEWPRVVANFVVQGGDPRGDTSGGPGYTIRDEIGRRRYGTGTVGMALAGPDTGGSQFFITHSPQPHLDGTYAIFGEVISGQPATEVLLPGDSIDTIRRTH